MNVNLVAEPSRTSSNWTLAQILKYILKFPAKPTLVEECLIFKRSLDDVQIL